MPTRSHPVIYDSVISVRSTAITRCSRFTITWNLSFIYEFYTPRADLLRPCRFILFMCAYANASVKIFCEFHVLTRKNSPSNNAIGLISKVQPKPDQTYARNDGFTSTLLGRFLNKKINFMDNILIQQIGKEIVSRLLSFTILGLGIYVGTKKVFMNI